MQQVGRYQIVGELGRGAMGVVYRALDPAIGRTIAIKTIRLSDLTNAAERERLRDRLFREAQSAGILSHPNIVTIYDILEENGLAYIFMEFVNGPPLENLLGSDRPPGRETLLSILRQTAAALDYAHKKGIVHRDIKPGNIMIHDDGTAKITDFGVAKILSQQMTQSGMMMGTPSYMSPEQVQGTDVTGSADQFALAVIAFEMLTGEKPFVAEQLPSLLYKICREDPVPAHRLNTTLAPEVSAVLRKALSKPPADRYPTCSDFVLDLERMCGLRPEWTPFARGASQSMPTVSAVPDQQAAIPARKEAADSGETIAGFAPPAAFDSDETVALAKPASLPAEVTAPVSASSVPSFAAPDDREGHLLRNLVLAAAAVLLIGGGYVLYRNWYSPAAQSTAENPTSQPDSQKAGAGSVAPPAAPQTSTVPPATPPPPPAVAQEREEPQPARSEPHRTQVSSPPPMLPARTPAGEDVITRIITSPPGARVTADGDSVLTCISPCALPLTAGRHALLARLDGYRDLNRIVETPRDSFISMDMERQLGTLSVTSSPPGAVIMINGQMRPERTPAVLKLPAGSYRLQVVSGNVKADEETVVIRDGVITTRRYTVE